MPCINCYPLLKDKKAKFFNHILGPKIFLAMLKPETKGSNPHLTLVGQNMQTKQETC